ncbi:sensor histidine kinase [Mucilaginibacter sp.]|uniref:sensor histidine kinase n=1 Tax=Mucilaginibacter sp. TaxID=1882438 RepID=UPI00356458F2
MITIVYRKRRNTQLIENIELKAAFRQELLKAQNEIQEQTLTNVSREIHDNITQVLSFVKLNLAMTGTLSEFEKAQKVNESRKLVAQAIADLRDLSKSMSFEHIVKLGLVTTIEIEAGRISKSGIVNVAFVVEGDTYPLGDQRELVLFRIFQEALNNVLKHSGAKLLKINLQYSEQIFTLTIADDGAGFLNNDLQKDGSGLKNMRSRATLIGAVLTINSEPGKGCCIKITIDPLLQQVYANANYPNSTG